MGDRDYFKRLFSSRYLDDAAFHERKKIFDIFIKTMNPKPYENIIDIGVFCGSPDPKLNFLEFLYNNPEKITAVGIEDAGFLEKQYKGLKFIKVEPNGPLPFADNQFEIGFCSATIEHIGSFEMQRRFLNEAVRVCKRFFLTTPNRFYPFEFHTRVIFLHWLPIKAFRKILSKLGLEFYSKEENLNLLNRNSLLSLVPEKYKKQSRLLYHRLFGIPSNLILIIEKSTGICGGDS
jgi:ubiquinone/menaquinone biosynthesis C-methylase UbiE